ncbi:MAG: dihydroorotate dehydrogenase electron transfer subunit [Planctomycetaceae bacterium]|nr:dihydroorotate dehydrogenase electron transfer subunit [Planctomycetaceae bacterium]
MSKVSASPRGTFTGEVLANEQVCDGHYRLILDVPHFPPSRPGQFVQLQCRYPGEREGVHVVEWPPGQAPKFTQAELTDREPFLRRPLSLAGRRDHARGAVELDILYRISGTGTAWLSGVTPGKSLSVLGPLGNAFPIDAGKPAAALIGGGVGIPPMLYLAAALQAAGKKTVAFNGSRSSCLLPLRLLPAGKVRPDGLPSHCIAEFAAWGVDAGVATDDGSLGFAGLVSRPFEQWLDQQPQPDRDLVVYTCGPEPMMKAVAEICISRNIQCYLSLERHMACGMGTCQSCVCKIKADTPQGWSFKLCCTDGPVFDARAVVW